MVLSRAAVRLAGVLAGLMLLSCTTAPETGPGAAETGGARTVVDQLETPWSVVHANRTAIISERDTGRILEVGSGRTRQIGSVAGVQAVGESGLLGLALRDGFLYAYSTGAETNRIHRYRLLGEPGSFRLGAAETVLDGLPAASYHDGGRIAFGPDGMLYATAGDAGDSSNAQDLRSLGGKILRMTPEGEPPDDNPFPGSLVYSYGHRNPQGLAWAPDGTLYSSEFGADAWDELNVIEPGANYGWPMAEGVAGRDGLTDPVQQWRPSEASPSGIAIDDSSIYIANLRGERLRVVPLSDPASSHELLTEQFGRLRDVAIAPDGELRILTSNTDGRGDPEPGDDRMLALPAP